MKTPTFRFEAEVLTDAPFGHIAGRLAAIASPGAFRCFRPLGQWLPIETGPDLIRLRWERRVAGALEQGSVTVHPDAKGAHLRLEGRMRGWAGFLLFGLMRWRTDRLLDRFVEEL